MAQPGCVRGRASAERLRSWWEVPAIAHFCSLFRAAFALPDFEIEEFEDALLVNNWDFLEDLVSKLLRGCYQRKDISIENFHMYLEDIIRHRWELEEGKENPLQGIQFRALSSRLIVEILHRLCDYRLDATDVFDLLKGLEADSLRVEALGEDSIGARYWYFYGTRLYKELPPPPPPKEEPKQKASKNDNKKGKKLKEEGKKKNSRVLHKNITTKGKDEKQTKKWKLRCSISKTSGKFERVEKGNGMIDETSDEGTNVQKENDAAGYNVSPVKIHLEERSTWCLVCHTLEEWQNLADCFRESQCSKERKLYKILAENFIPEISNLIVQKERQLQKKFAEIVPRRASDRLLVKRTQQEDLFSSLLKERQAVFGRLGENRMKDGYYFAAQRMYTPQEIKRIEEEGRILAREERARRRQLREEKTMLISEVKNALRKKHNRAVHSPVKLEEPDEKRPEVHYTDDEEYVSMYKVLDTVKVHKDSWPFNEPVDESYAPDYHKIVEEPMDLSTIENKLSEKKYNSKWAFISDFRLMFDNCEQYNGKGNEYTLMARAVERCFNKAMAKYFPKDEVDSDEEFQTKMMWEKKDKHKSKPNHLAKDETEVLTNATDHVLGLQKVNGFVNSHPASDVPQIVADPKKEGNSQWQLCNMLPLPGQTQTMEEKNSANGPQSSSEIIHQPQALGVPGRTVMEPIRKRLQQQYRMQQQMLMNGPAAPASAGCNSAGLQTASLSSISCGTAPPNTGMPTIPTDAQEPMHSPVCTPNRPTNLGLPQTETETPSSHPATAVPTTHGNRGTTVPLNPPIGDCHVTDLNLTKGPEWPGYLYRSIYPPQHRLPAGEPNPVSSQGVSMEHTGPAVQNHPSATSNSITGTRSPIKNEILPNTCGISVKYSEPLPSQAQMQNSVFNTFKSSHNPLDQTSQRPPVKGAPLEQAAYSNLFSTDQHHLVNKEPVSSKVTPLNTSVASNLLQQDTTGKSAESERLDENGALKKEQKLFINNAIDEKDSEDCKLREGLNSVLSKVEDCVKRHTYSDIQKEMVRTEIDLKNKNLISQKVERPKLASDKCEATYLQKSLIAGGKHSMKDPKSTENLRLKLASNAEALTDVPNGSSETAGSVQQRNPAMLVAHPETRHQFGPVSAYMHYLGCNPENLPSGHSFVQHAPHLMVVHPMQGQTSHFYQHPTQQQQISSQMSNLGYHPQQPIQSAVMSDRGYLAGQSGLYCQSPLMFLREGSGQSQTNLRDRTDAFSEQLMPERDECKPLHEASVKKQKNEAVERRVAASKMESNSEKTSKRGRQQDCLDLDGQNTTKRQKVIHAASAAYNTSQMTSGIYSHQIPHPALYANAPSHNVQRLPYGQPYNPQLLRVHSVITSTSNHMIPHQVMNHSPIGMQLFSQSEVKPNPYPGTVIVQRPQFSTSGDLYMVRSLMPDYPVLKQMGRRDPDTMPQSQDKTAPPLCMNQP
ncbi:chromatin remodeling regulator CECR2-like isoform X2 [Heptranchias perlo]|uniref:chromatin remodeling regulator CECR2-like isoform X2 n=1 Tax=Heptranchias perlo TaxID=212740 RepID=UPI0035599733